MGTHTHGGKEPAGYGGSRTQCNKVSTSDAFRLPFCAARLIPQQNDASGDAAEVNLLAIGDRLCRLAN
jgi:hypothetical protein